MQTLQQIMAVDDSGNNQRLITVVFVQRHALGCLRVLGRRYGSRMSRK
jgi:hypothetical protein